MENDPIKTENSVQLSPQRPEVITPDPLTTISGTNAERDQLILLRAKLDYSQRMAKMFAYSGCFADIKDTREDVAIAKALVKIKLGESMGFSEAEAMTGIDIIQGRVAVGASLRAARMQRAGYSWPQMVCNDTGCWIPLVFKGDPMLQQKVNEKGELVFDSGGKPVMTQVVVSFTQRDAHLASLAGKDNYKKDPSSMYFARAITRAQRRYGPGVLGVDILDTYEARDLAPAGSIMHDAGREPMIGTETVGEHATRLQRQMDEQADGPASEPKPETAERSNVTPINQAAQGTDLKANWPNRVAMMKAFADLVEDIGQDVAIRVLADNGIADDDGFSTTDAPTKAAYDTLAQMAKEKKAKDNPEPPPPPANKPVFGRKK